MRRIAVNVMCACLALCLANSLHAQNATESWGIVRTVVGRNVVLDDGQLVRLQEGTRVIRADGNVGTREDINRGCKLTVIRAADGGVSKVQVFAPVSLDLVYLSNVAPARGTACVTTVEIGKEKKFRSLALTRATYSRPANWTQFRCQVRYDPATVKGAPAAARFMLKDSYGETIVQRVLTRGATAPLNAGLDAQATDRITLETAPAGEGTLPQEACLWLDPQFVVGVPTATPMALSKDTSTRIEAALTERLGETKLDALAIADFKPIRPPKDQSFVQDLSRDLIVILGKKYTIAGHHRKQLDPGTPLPEAEQKELEKLQASHVLTGSVNWRQEGVVVHALLVQVDNGALITAVTVRD